MVTRKELNKRITKKREEYKGMFNDSPIYEIMTIQYPDQTMKTEGGKDLGWPDEGAIGHPGFYHELGCAIDTLETNNCGIEERVYRGAFILVRFPGMYSACGSDMRMFFRWDDEREGFFQDEEPKHFANIAY